MSKMSDLGAILSDICLSEGTISLFKSIGYLAQRKNENSVGQMIRKQHEEIKNLEFEIDALKKEFKQTEKIQQILKKHPKFTEAEIKSLLHENPLYNCEELAGLLQKFPNYTISELDEYMKKNSSRSKGAKK